MVKPAQAKNHRPIRTSNAPTNPERQIGKNQTHMRDNATIRRLKMYNTRPVRSRDGKFIGGSLMSRWPLSLFFFLPSFRLLFLFPEPFFFSETHHQKFESKALPPILRMPTRWDKSNWKNLEMRWALPPMTPTNLLLSKARSRGVC